MKIEAFCGKCGRALSAHEARRKHVGEYVDPFGAVQVWWAILCPTCEGDLSWAVEAEKATMLIPRASMRSCKQLKKTKMGGGDAVPPAARRAESERG